MKGRNEGRKKGGRERKKGFVSSVVCFQSGFLAFVVFVALVLAILFCLGFWQYTACNCICCDHIRLVLMYGFGG